MALSEDIMDDHNPASGIAGRVEESTEHPTVHRVRPTRKNYLIPNSIMLRFW